MFDLNALYVGYFLPMIFAVFFAAAAVTYNKVPKEFSICPSLGEYYKFVLIMAMIPLYNFALIAIFIAEYWRKNR